VDFFPRTTGNLYTTMSAYCLFVVSEINKHGPTEDIYGCDICSIIVNYLFYVKTLGPRSENWRVGRWNSWTKTLCGIVHLTLDLSYYYAYRPDSCRFSCLNYDLQLSQVSQAAPLFPSDKQFGKCEYSMTLDLSTRRIVWITGYVIYNRDFRLQHAYRRGLPIWRT